jgi:hypothetical protein
MRWVSDPASYKPLAGFACGGESDYEHEVEGVLDQLRELSPEDADEYRIRAAEARDDGDLIALSVFHKRPLGESGLLRDAVYLALAAVNEPYRGRRMPDGTRIGTFMLCDTLAQIENLWGHPMPCVWGLVHRDNKSCQNVLSRHSFWRLRASNRDPANPAYFVHQRQEDLDWAHGFSPQLLEAVELASTQ